MDLPSPERWKRIEDIFDAALEQLPGARATFVRAACGDDDDLRVRVMRLLECAAATDPRLDEPAIDFAAQLLKHAAAESAPPLRPEIDRYRIMREIGRGGMGTVYLAERADFKQRVALKLIHHGLHLDEQLVLRFRDEREILASLEHPNIARLLDGGLTDDGLPYFVMEYVEGEALDRYCDANRLTIDERLALFCQICEAVQHAHVKGIVHRDLKPSNVLVTRDGRAKLLDFGIAKLLAADGVEVRALTRTGHRPMTPEYASPEQFRAETVGPTSDVYSLGVLLYELLTGQRPCRATTRTPHEFERAVLEEEPVAPSVVVQPGPSSRPDDTDVSAADVARNRATAPDRLPRRLRGDLDAIVLKSLDVGAFVYGDASSASSVAAATDNQFVVRAQKIWLGTNNSVTSTANRFLETSTGAYLSTGGVWISSSDSTKKHHWADVDGEAVLASLATLPIQTWSYRVEDDAVRHMGPTAQDFRAAFGLGDTDRGIAGVDADGVSLAGIKALIARTAELRSELETMRTSQDTLHTQMAALRRDNDALQSMLGDLLLRLAALEASAR